MKARMLTYVALAVVLSLTLTGCLTATGGRTSNQGGSSVLAATQKILQNRIGSLNPDDIQVLADLAAQFTEFPLPEVTDEQAAVVVSLIQANNITTIASIEDFVRRAEADPNSIVIPADVQAFIDQATQDPGSVLPQEILDLFGTITTQQEAYRRIARDGV
jgi:hypothetical protein